MQSRSFAVLLLFALVQSLYAHTITLTYYGNSTMCDAPASLQATFVFQDDSPSNCSAVMLTAAGLNSSNVPYAYSLIVLDSTCTNLTGLTYNDSGCNSQVSDPGLFQVFSASGLNNCFDTTLTATSGLMSFLRVNLTSSSSMLVATNTCGVNATVLPTNVTANATAAPTVLPTNVTANATAAPTVLPTNATATPTVLPTNATANATDLPTASSNATDLPTASSNATVLPTASSNATVLPTASSNATVLPTTSPNTTNTPTKPSAASGLVISALLVVVLAILL